MSSTRFTLADYQMMVDRVAGKGNKRENLSIVEGKPANKGKVAISASNKYFSTLMFFLRQRGIEYETEYKFAPDRKFRFDLCAPSIMVGWEYEGLVFNANKDKGTGKSGHTAISVYVSNCEKYNLAQILGYKILRYTALSINDCIPDIEKLLK